MTPSNSQCLSSRPQSDDYPDTLSYPERQRDRPREAAATSPLASGQSASEERCQFRQVFWKMRAVHPQRRLPEARSL
jgi:hypothetical protein